MADEHPPPVSRGLAQWQRRLASANWAGVSASIREDQRGDLWLCADAPAGGTWARLHEPFVGLTASGWPVQAVGGTRPDETEHVRVMGGQGHLVDATLGPGVWVAVLPKRARVSGVLFLDHAENIVGQRLAPWAPPPPGLRFRLTSRLRSAIQNLNFIKVPCRAYTYGPSARRRR